MEVTKSFSLTRYWVRLNDLVKRIFFSCIFGEQAICKNTDRYIYGCNKLKNMVFLFHLYRRTCIERIECTRIILLFLRFSFFFFLFFLWSSRSNGFLISCFYCTIYRFKSLNVFFFLLLISSYTFFLVFSSPYSMLYVYLLCLMKYSLTYNAYTIFPFFSIRVHTHAYLCSIVI